ncbi:MAG TPA: PAS domain-containing protein [Candidatus Acidoferrales bacterium]|jgi:PAS domain S-box-containing protein|nr:PAS domain-containing protein [Candidatus Acidoferrales bacterium]
MACFDWLGVSGELAALITAKCWSDTPLGPPDKWSPTLRMTLRFLLANRFPALLWWGPERVQFYNDAFISILGEKHPRALGQCGSDCWQEIWGGLCPHVDTSLKGAPAKWIEDLELEIRRFDFTEETHFTIAFSPVPDDTVPGGIGGVLATVHEITEQVVSARRLGILPKLSARATEAKTPEQSCAFAAKVLEDNPKDIPFALLYLLDPDGKKARLEGVAGAKAGKAVSPTVVDLDKPTNKDSDWPLQEVLRTESMVVVENIDKIFKKIPFGHWPDPPNKAAVLPIRSNKVHEFLGALVIGISPRLAMNKRYVDFLELVSTQIGAAVGNAHAFEDERKKARHLAEIDLTARKHAETKLRESEQRMLLAFDASQMGFWHRNLITGEVLWSPRHEVIYGYEPGTASRRFADFLNRLHPDDAESVDFRIRESQAKRTDLIHEFRIVWPDKSVHWIRAFGRFLYDGDGNPTQILGTSEEITVRKEAEAALRKSEERLRVTLEASQLGIWHWDLKTGELLWDARQEAIYGYELGTHRRNYMDFTNRLHPEDAERVNQQIQDSRENWSPHSSEFRIVWPDKSVRWIRALGRFLYDSEGNPTQMLGTDEDITQRKQVEEAIRINENKLRRAHKAARSGAWEWHLDTGQVVWSPEIELLYGLPSGTFAGNMDAWRKMVHPEDLAKIERYLPAVYKNSNDLRMEFRITRMDGQVRWLEAVGQVIRDSHGNAQLVAGISTDITERKGVENELRLTTERFELALRDSSIAVFNQDLNLRYTWIYNPDFGYQAREFIGKCDRDIYDRLEDAEVTETIKLDVIRTGLSRRQEVAIRHRNANRYYDLLVDPLKDSNGKITGVTCAAIDMTERKRGEKALQRSEYRFRTLIESNIIPIICCNDHLITEANDAFLELVDYSREELAAGRIDWVKITPPVYKLKDSQAMEQLKNCLFAPPYEKEFIRKDGVRVPIFIGLTMLSQSPEEYLCFILDLSELKHVEAELRKYQHELEQKVAERTLELTLSLAAVGSEIKVRKETEEQLRELSGRLLRLQDEEHRRIARELHDSTGQTLSALKMSLSLLAQHVENVPRGKALLEDLNMLADSAIQEVRTTSHLLHPPMLDEVGFSSAARWYLEGFAKRSGINVSIDFGDLPELTKDEELALFRVLQESLTNVHRHSGSPSAEIRIYSEGESVILSIRDFGQGIPPEKIEKFNKTGAGVGVGLGGMKQRLHKLGGNLEVRSEGNGTTIFAKLRQPKLKGEAAFYGKIV